MNPRTLLTAAVGVAAFALLAGQVRTLATDLTVWPPDDFVEYWAAARLTLDGQNPYDPARLLPLQRAAGRDTDEAVMMWNPPWALTAVLPLGLLDARAAQIGWLFANLAAVVFAGGRLWRAFGGRPGRAWVGAVLAFAFVPTLFALHSGQIGPLLLLGAALFAACLERGRADPSFAWDAAAGASTVLLAVKPHLAYLVWVAVACDAVARRRVGVIAGGAAAGVAATLLPLAFNPHLLAQYADAMANRPPEQWVSPTLGTVLRLLLGEDLFRLQFAPVAAGLLWFAWHRAARRRDWDTLEQLPLLLLVSFVTAPYGAWPFDLVLLVPAVVRVAAAVDRGRVARPGLVVAGYVLVNAGCLAMNLARVNSFWFLWVAPAMLALYAFARRSGPARVAGDPAAAVAQPVGVAP